MRSNFGSNLHYLIYELPLIRERIYSWELKNKHLKNRNIWIADFYKSGVQSIRYSDAWFLLLTMQENCGQIVCYSDHHWNNRLKQSGIQIPIQITDHWIADYFWPFKYQTSPVFRSPFLLNYEMWRESEKYLNLEVIHYWPLNHW